MRQSGSQMETNNRRYSNMDTSRRDMLLASLLATLPAMVVSEAVASPINPAQTIIQPPADHHWVSNKNYPERSVDMCPLAGSLTEPGLYLTLVRWWPGYMSAPHTYVTDRLCVVVSGTWWCNSGDDFDPASCVPEQSTPNLTSCGPCTSGVTRCSRMRSRCDLSENRACPSAPCQWDQLGWQVHAEHLASRFLSDSGH
jgi:hypothetical protein